MKKTGRWLMSVSARVVAVLLIVMLFPFVSRWARNLFFDIQGEIRTQSIVLTRKLEASQRLETVKVSEEGTLQADTSVILLGTVGTTVIDYRYEASLGIDLKKVELRTEEERIVFLLPELEVLTDSIEAQKVNKQNFWSRAIEKSTEQLLSEKRESCRRYYLEENEHSAETWADTVKALENTVCQWLEGTGDRHYAFDFQKKGES